MTLEEIDEIVAKRLAILKENDKDKEVDIISNMVINLFKKEDYPCDFIIETLTKFGQAPCIMYDDNGNFAVSSDGYNEVVYGNKKLQGAMTTFVEKKMWKKTIREAINYYLKNQ